MIELDLDDIRFISMEIEVRSLPPTGTIISIKGARYDHVNEKPNGLGSAHS